MNDVQKFEAFKQRVVEWNEATYGTEARARYGDTEVEEAQTAVLNLTQEQYQEWKRLGEEIQRRLEKAVQANVKPESQEGEAIAQLHRRWLTLTGNSYDSQKHKGLVQIYVSDERFADYYDKAIPGCAKFLRDAVYCWAEN